MHVSATLRSVILLLVATLGLPGCAPDVRHNKPGVLVVTESEQTASFVRNFNPFFELGNVRWPTRHAMYEPLAIYNVIAGDYVPWLATGYSWSEDNKTLTFTLRDDVRWSDGEQFDSRDVAETFAIMKRHAALDLRGIWKSLERIETPDDKTVTFVLPRADVSALESLAQTPIVPAHIWSKVEDPVAWQNPNPVATGPFTAVGAFENQSYEVHKNPHYWKTGKPAVDTIRFLAFPGNEQTNLALVRGEIDWAGDFVPAIDRVYVGRNPEHHHYWFPLIDGTVFLYPNTTKPPFDDVRVRKALSMAIDRSLLVKVAMHDYTVPADATALSGAYEHYRNPAAVQAGTWVQHDPTQARALLDQSGHAAIAGTRFPVELMVPAGFSDWVRGTQVIARGLQEIGIEVRVKTYDFNAWFEKLQSGDFELSMGWSEVHPTPYALFRTLMSTQTLRPIGTAASTNWHRFGLPEADDLLETLAITTDRAKQKPLVDQLQMLFVEHAPALPLFPGPLWGEFNTTRFTGFPSKANPYAPLTPNWAPQSLLVLTELKPR
jgi:peptide/nickel transport system substrate-binding protein